MYATVALRGRLGEERTLAPLEAVVDTGARKVAFVAAGPGHFEPRDVRTGAEADDGRVEILEGLSPGEQVVTSGQFLIDSEARVRESLAKMIHGDLAAPPAPAGPALAHLPPEALTPLTALLDGYAAVRRSLASDRLAPAAERQALAQAVDRLAAVEVPGAPGYWREHGAAELGEGARALAQEGSLDGARKAFLQVSRLVGELVRATGVPAARAPLEELHCPMYGEGDAGATWLQPAGPPVNPYMGKAMVACFDRRAPLPAAAEAAP
jgi:hypothetical protein